MAQYTTIHDQEVAVGDTVAIHQKIQEGDKSRTQIFEGIVIAIKGREEGKTITIRKIGANQIGVEKIFPIQLPSIQKVVVKKKGDIRRAKLYYLRDRIGKSATRLREKKVDVKKNDNAKKS